jgi:ABC-type sugar transport system ATPase subunit
MGGREDVQDTGPKRSRRDIQQARAINAKEALCINGAKLGGRVTGFDFRVHEGELVGVAGVEGSGKEELLRLCAGLGSDDGSNSDVIKVNGSPIRKRLRSLLEGGVVYLSGDRQRDGVFGRLSIAENMAVSRRAMAPLPDTAIIRRAHERGRAKALVQRLGVKAASVDAPLQSLSGGNQQKVLLGRCLELNPRVMLLDNVTRGVDIGAKETIYKLLQSLSEQGVAVVLASDDLAELTTVADRLVVLKGGAVTGEFDNVDRSVSPLNLLAAII